MKAAPSLPPHAQGTRRRRTILLVEDNPVDLQLLREAFRRLPDPPEILHQPDGVAALDFLQAAAVTAQLPDIVLLDLNMPRLDGREVLLRIKQDQRLRGMPVLILTSSNSDADIRRIYDQQANGYLIKPPDLTALFELAEMIHYYWFGMVRLPR